MEEQEKDLAPVAGSGGEKTASKKTSATVVIVAIVIVLAILGIGGYLAQKFIFQKAGEKVAESLMEGVTGSDVDISSGGEGVSVSNEDGSLDIGEGAKWPDNMPSSVPEFTGGTIQMSGEYSGTWSVTVTGATSSEVDSYIADLKALGWNQDQANFDMGTASMSQLSNGQYSLTITFSSEEGSVSITVSPVA